MRTSELSRRLFDEGCDAASYVIGPRGAASDAYCLTLVGEEWRIYYTERGVDQPPMETFEHEPEACDAFCKLILSMRHDHCVGFFRSRDRAAALMKQLGALGLDPREDSIPYGGPRDPRFRVFVTGKAIFTAKDALIAVPQMDDDS